MSELTREQMEAEIAQGRSILFNPTPTAPGGRQASSVESLPSVAEMALASGDAVKLASARRVLEAEKALLEARLAAIDEAEQQATAPAAEAEPEPQKAEPQVALAPEKPRAVGPRPADAAPAPVHGVKPNPAKDESRGK